MPLLPNIEQPAVVPQANKEQVLNRVVERIRNKTKESFREFVHTQRDGIDILWKNDILTPQEVIDGLGDDALKIFQFHGALTNLIQQLAQIDDVQVNLATPTNAFEIVQGKIVVLDEPYDA